MDTDKNLGAETLSTNSKIAMAVVGVIVLLGIVAWAANSGGSNSNNTGTTTTTSSVTNGTGAISNTPSTATPSTTGTSSASADHISNYISSLIYALNYLYQSTQEITNAQTQYPTLSQEEQVMTASLNLNTDLSGASSALQPYINDQNDAISSTAKITYADILLIQKANNTVDQDLKNATPENFNPQQMSYDLAQLASAQSTLQKDLFQNQVLYVILKGIIEIPVNGTPTGPINFSLSSSQRQDLTSQIQTTFGTTLGNYNNNSYLLAVKLIQITLSFNTYEEQSSYKLQ